MIEIIPAIDIIDGKCVRLSQGDFARKKIYNENPLEVAKQFEDTGIKRLHIVDLDGAKHGKVINLKVLEQISLQTKLIIDFGGGIKTTESAQQVFDAGAKMISIGTMAVKDPKLFQELLLKFGSERILLGADVKVAAPSLKGEDNYFLSVNGWTEQTKISIFDFIKTNLEKGVKNIFCTDISKDGMMQGPSVKLYKEIINSFKHPLGRGALNLIASGGVNSIEDIFQLEKAGCSGVIIGKAIYEGKIKLVDLKPFLS